MMIIFSIMKEQQTMRRNGCVQRSEGLLRKGIPVQGARDKKRILGAEHCARPLRYRSRGSQGAPADAERPWRTHFDTNGLPYFKAVPACRCVVRVPAASAAVIPL